MKAKDDLSSLSTKIQSFEAELSSLSKDYKANKISKDVFLSKSKYLKNSISELASTARKLSYIDNAVGHVVEAVDPTHVQGILNSLYSTCLVGVAAVQSKTIATCTYLK